MAFIIPNAVDTTSGNKYVALDQAEPDSIDFEILGNGNSGVITGCEVGPTPVQGGSVAVSEGAVVINGTRYQVAANSFLLLPAPPSTVRFDLIVARLSGTTVSPVSLFGNESSTNPTFPKSKTNMVTTAGANVLSYYNPDTDVVLAAIYRFGSTNVVSSYIIDKRRFMQSPIVFRGTVAPTASQGSIGDLYLRTGNVNTGESGVYVKQSATQWIQFGDSSVDPGVPIGTLITWVAPTAPNGAVWLECNGTAVSRSLYSGLFSVLGTTYGSGDGATTFNLPDFRGMYMAGMPISGGALNTPTGNIGNQITLTANNLPQHTHTINHGHAQTTTNKGGDHTHTSGATSAQFAIALDSSQSASYVAPRDNTGWGGTNSNPAGFADGYTIDLGFAVSSNSTGMALSKTKNTSKADPTTHDHTLAIPTSTGLVSGSAGQASPTAVSIQPRTMYVKYYIRCS